MLNFFKELILILAGIITAIIGLKGFLIPNEFIDGGVTGISLLLSLTTNLNVSFFIFIVNLPFIYIAKKQVGKIFAIKTFFAIITLSLLLHFLEIPKLTDDPLLVSVFGGFFLGAGIGLSVRGGSVIDGTEVLAVALSRKIGITMGDVILLINVVIFCAAAFLLSIEVALYSLLTYLAASKSVDFIVHGIEEYIGLTVISKESEAIRKKLVEHLGKGVTVYKGKGGYGVDYTSVKDQDILFAVATRLEIVKIKNEILNIDPSAFIIEQSINDAKGGIVKRRPLH